MMFSKNLLKLKFIKTSFSRFFSSEVEKCSPLEGIKVLDLTRILAGPYCTMILGDLGADIYKIENPIGGDESRQWGPPFIGTESCYFASINRNKKSVALNLKTKEGQNLCKEMAKQCDILVENYVPGKLDQLGLGYEDLKKIAPKLIYCSITGYGSDGPYANRPGFDVIASSVGGLMNITGPENGDPVKVGVAVTDLSTGLYAHGAIMASLLQRQVTGKGQKIDCNLLSTQISMLVNIGSNYLNSGQEAKRLGTAHESIVPYQSFKTADGYIAVGGTSNHKFATMCKVLGLEDLLSEAQFKNNEDRVKNRVKLLQIINARFLTKTNAEWLKLFDGSNIPYGPINSMKEAFADAQVLHSNIVQEVQHATVGSIYMTGPPVRYSDSVNTIRLPPPLLGQHTKEVLNDKLQIIDNETFQKYENMEILKQCDLNL